MKKSILTSAGVLLGACALCCVGPLLAFLGISGLASVTAAFQSLEMGLAGLAVAAVSFGLYKFFKLKKVTSCNVDCGGLGFPSVTSKIIWSKLDTWVTLYSEAINAPSATYYPKTLCVDKLDSFDWRMIHASLRHKV